MVLLMFSCYSLGHIWILFSKNWVKEIKGSFFFDFFFLKKKKDM
jgi:hypothetical protein